jgi:hypothetical protein
MDELKGYSEEGEKRALREEIERFITLILFVIAMAISLVSSNKK